MNPGEKIKDWAQRSRQFYQETRNEMRKVSWPSRQEVFSTTVVVIIAVVFFGIYLGAVDVVLSAGLERVLSYFRVSGV